MSLATPLAAHFDALPAAWQTAAPFPRTPACEALCAYIDARTAAGAMVYPAQPLAALHATALADTCIVILGQDPYHGPGQAHGLAFSVPEGVACPPSLRNILAELRRDLGVVPAGGGCLRAWAAQGVLLLNTVLTVEAGAPGSHAGRGWEHYTDGLIEALAADPQPRVFLLWGAQAQAKRGLIEAGGGPHRVLCANHPSPLAARRPPRPYIGCGHFSEANRYLQSCGRAPVDWGASAR